MNPDIELKLSSQRALLGAVTEGLRAVSTEIRDNVIFWRCVFVSEEAKESQWDELSAAATEVIADYPEGYTIDEEYLVIPLSNGSNHIEHLKNIVFLRCENRAQTPKKYYPQQ